MFWLEQGDESEQSCETRENEHEDRRSEENDLETDPTLDVLGGAVVREQVEEPLDQEKQPRTAEDGGHREQQDRSYHNDHTPSGESRRGYFPSHPTDLFCSDAFRGEFPKRKKQHEGKAREQFYYIPEM